MDIKQNRGTIASASPADVKPGSLPSDTGIIIRTMQQDLESSPSKSISAPSKSPSLASNVSKPSVPSAPVPSFAPVSPKPSSPSRDDLLKLDEKKREEDKIKREIEEKARKEAAEKKEGEIKLQKEREEAERNKKDVDLIEKLANEYKPVAPSVPAQPNLVKMAAPPIDLPVASKPVSIPEPPKREIKLAEPLKPEISSIIPPKPAIVPAPPKPAAPTMPPPSILSDFAEPKEPAITGGLNKGRLVLVIIAALVLLGGGGSWLFLKLSAQSVATPSPTLSVSPSQSATPSATPGIETQYFKMDSREVITLEGASSTQALLMGKLQNLTQSEKNIGSFSQIVVNDQNNQTLDLQEIVSALKMDIFDLPVQKCDAPEQCAGISNLKEDLDLTKFVLFSYYQSLSSGTSPFDLSQNQGRIGLIVSLKDQATTTSAKLKRDLAQVESFMPESLGSLFLGKKVDLPKIPTFSDNTYHNLPIRYINLIGVGLTIDYTILGDKLIFTTSKESMYSVIDKLLEQNPL